MSLSESFFTSVLKSMFPSESLFLCLRRKACFNVPVEKHVSKSARKVCFQVYVRKPISTKKLLCVCVRNHVSMSASESMFLYLSRKVGFHVHVKACFHQESCFHICLGKPISMFMFIFMSESMCLYLYRKVCLNQSSDSHKNLGILKS